MISLSDYNLSKSSCDVTPHEIFTVLESLNINIHDLSENIESTAKLFVDDTSLFSVVHNNKTSAEVLNRDLQKISESAHKWKMSFNPDVSKQAQEVIFSRKQAKSMHPDLVFNNIPVHQTHCQEYI